MAAIAASGARAFKRIEVIPNPSLIGAEIRGVDLSAPLDDATLTEISDAFDTWSVITIRDQHITPEQQIAFSRRLGPLQINVRTDFAKPGYPEILVVSNILDEQGKPIGSIDAGRYWHSDLCYLPRPSKATMLYAHEVPMQDGTTFGATQFASCLAAYDALPEEMKRRLAGLKGENSYIFMYDSKVRDFGKQPLSDAEKAQRFPPAAVHPVIRTHPVTGRKGIFVCEGYTQRIQGLPDAESSALLQFLFAHTVKPEFVYRHQWRIGDVLMWDNAAVLHKVTNDYGLPLRRRLDRTSIEGGVPV